LSLIISEGSIHAALATDADGKTTFLPITNTTAIVKKTPDGLLQSMAFRAMIYLSKPRLETTEYLNNKTIENHRAQLRVAMKNVLDHTEKTISEIHYQQQDV
jgi:hypothetical protein